LLRADVWPAGQYPESLAQTHPETTPASALLVTASLKAYTSRSSLL
jgi:hypothetical protein